MITIGDWAFEGCAGLTEISIADSVTTSGYGVFTFCTNLISMRIGSGMTSLGSPGLLGGSPNLKSIYFKGTPPLVNEPPSRTATFYYLPGRTGWGSTWFGRPVLLWNPEIQTGGPSFGIGANGFGFTVTGTSNLVVVVEAATDLAHPDWAPVVTHTITGGSATFTEPQWTNHPARFYRVRGQ